MTKVYEIIVVDMDPETHLLVSDRMTRLGYKVTWFETADVALAKSTLLGRDWDVVLTDFHILKYSSDEFTSQLKSRFQIYLLLYWRIWMRPNPQWKSSTKAPTISSQSLYTSPRCKLPLSARSS